MSASNQPAVIEESNTGTSGDNVVRLRGLPWTATENDLVNFFSGITIQPNGITFQLNSEGKPTGEAYVQLATKRDFDEATARHKNYMGSRYIEVFASSTADFKKYLKAANYSSSSPHHPPPHRGYRSSNYSPPRKPHGYSHHLSRQSPDSLYPPSESRIIRMRGLPYSVSVFDILDFFYNLDITEEDIIICKKPNGLITGEGFLRLYSNEDVHLAMKKHKERIGSRYIELFPSNEAELESYSQSYYDEHHHHHHPPPPPHHHEPYYRDRERDRDHRDRERDHRDRDIHPYHREGSSGSGRSYHLDYHSKPSGSSRGDLYPHPHHHHGDWPPPLPDHHHHLPPSPPYSGSRHFVIRMRGIPFNATPYDIQTFFNGFRILPKGIHFLYKSQNRPAGEAFVEFEYEDDYHRALLKNTALMGDRYIELFRSSVADLAKNEEYLKTYDPLFSDTPLPLSSFPLPNSFPPLNYPPSMSNGSSTLTPVGGNPYSSSSPSSSSVPPSAQVPSNLTDPNLLLQLIQQNSTFTPTQMRAFLNICDTNPSSAPSSLDSTSQMNSYYALHKIVDQVDKTRPPSSAPYSSLSSTSSSQNETTIYMRNLELHTKVSDVEQFFQNYRYLKGSIEIYYNPYRGTNDGHITFDSHQEASRACQEMNGFKIRSLKVQLLMNPDSLNNNNNTSIP